VALNRSSAERSHSVRPLLEKVGEIHSTVVHHLAKEEEQLFPLLLANFSHAEQAELVAEFLCRIPLAAADSVLSWLMPIVPPQEQLDLLEQVCGVVGDELQGRLLAAWLRRDQTSTEATAAPGGVEALEKPLEGRRSSYLGALLKGGHEEKAKGRQQPPPVLLLHHIHAAIRFSLNEFVDETLAVEAASAKGNGLGQQNLGADSLTSLLEQYRFLRAMCTFHSSSENETVLWAKRLEDGQEHQREQPSSVPVSVSCAEQLNGHDKDPGKEISEHHDIGAADFDALGRLLADVRSCARRGNKRAAALATQLRKSAEAVRSSVDTHMREEEAETIPLLAASCSVAEQRQLVWNTIRAMPLRLLESLLPWIASQVPPAPLLFIIFFSSFLLFKVFIPRSIVFLSSFP
jgi:zinc finger-like protein